MRVFISSQSVDRAPAKELICLLREKQADVVHSPSNPLDGDDPRWKGWYASGLVAAVRQCDAFVIVVDPAWDSSTWMCQEAQVAFTSEKKSERCFFWNPNGIVVRAAGMLPYLQRELPRDLHAAVNVLLKL